MSHIVHTYQVPYDGTKTTYVFVLFYPCIWLANISFGELFGPY